MVSHAGAAAIGILADQALGEPPDGAHPVAAFGRVMQYVEEHLHADERQAGVAHAATGVLIGIVAGRLVRSTALATWSATAGKALGIAALQMADALERDDLDRARSLLPTLVGRDPAGLDAKDMARAVIESVAENTIDAIVAPALWATVGGAPGVLAHRAINTMDAMVGHHNERYERYGWAAARLDDAAAWLPARLGAALVAVCRPQVAGAVLHAVRRDAPAHPSPNGGVIEAAFAVALGLQLGGESTYGDRVELRPTLGSGRPCEPKDIAAAVRLSRDVTLALAALLVATDVAARRPRRRS